MKEVQLLIILIFCSPRAPYYTYVYIFEPFLKGKIQNRFNLISEARVKILEQNC